MAEESVREYLENNSALLEDIRGTLIQSNTRLESVVDILTVQSNTLAEQMRVDALARENEELRLAESEREASRLQEASGRMERDAAGPAMGALDTPTRGGLLRNLITAGLLAALGTAAYRYFGLDEFKDELLGDEAYDEFKQSVGDKFDSLIFGEQTESGERVGGLMGAIESNPVGAAAAGAGLVTFLMNGARFRALPAAMASFMLGYIGLNAFFNPEGNTEVANSIDDGINYLETEFGTQFFNILRDNYGIDVTGEGVVNLLEAAAIYKGTSLALRLFGVAGRGRFLIPLAGAMASFAFNYFGLDDFFRPDDDEEMFDFLESEVMAEYGSLIAGALGMAVMAFGPGMAAGLATGAANAGKSRSPKGTSSLRTRLLGRLPGGGRGALLAIAATAIAAYTFNRLGLDDLFSGEDTDLDESLDEAAQEALQRQIDAAAVGAAVGVGVGAANTRYARRGYVYDCNTRQYRVAPGSSTGGRFASRAIAERTALEAFPKLARLFRAIPGLSAAFAAYDGYYIITDPNLSVEDKVAMLGGVFGGLSLSVIMGGAGLLVGGPIGAGIGGLAGYFAGDYIVRELLLWILSDNDDALNRIQSEAERIQGQREQAELNAREYYLEQGRDPSRLDVENVPIGRVSSARLPGATGTIAPGMETSALDVISERDTTAFDTYIPPLEPMTEPSAAPQTPVIEGGASTTAPDIAQGIRESAAALGVSAEDLATAISYETSGTMDPLKYGPTTQWGRHRGLIQFGEPQAAQYGVDFSSREAAINSQLGPNGAIVQFLRDTGVRPGMGLLEIYSAINAGGVGPEYYVRTDENNGGAPGTVADKVNMQMAGHRARAQRILGQGEEISSLSNRASVAAVTPSALRLGAMSGNVNVPVTTVVNNIDNSQNIASAGKGSGAARTAAARNVRRDTSYMSSAMTQYA